MKLDRRPAGLWDIDSALAYIEGDQPSSRKGKKKKSLPSLPNNIGCPKAANNASKPVANAIPVEPVTNTEGKLTVTNVKEDVEKTQLKKEVDKLKIQLAIKIYILHQIVFL